MHKWKSTVQNSFVYQQIGWFYWAWSWKEFFVQWLWYKSNIICFLKSEEYTGYKLCIQKIAWWQIDWENLKILSLKTDFPEQCLWTLGVFFLAMKRFTSCLLQLHDIFCQLWRYFSWMEGETDMRTNLFVRIGSRKPERSKTQRSKSGNGAGGPIFVVHQVGCCKRNRRCSHTLRSK